MLNYIWAGLIVASLGFALWTDIDEIVSDRFRTDEPLPATIVFEEGADPSARRLDVRVRIDSATYTRFYDDPEPLASEYLGTLVQTQEGQQLQFGASDVLPEPLGLIQEHLQDDEGDPIRSRRIDDFRWNVDSTSAQVGLTFPEVRFRKLNDISQAALDFAETAASLALSLIGVLALFLGLLKIAEEAGIIYSLTRFVEPLLRPLFPQVPAGHPALGHVSLNLLANVFGLGNAATPLGIKAMESMNELNPSKDTASDAMVMLLALNTSSVQLVPPVLLVAIMGLQINQLIFAIILATTFSTIAGILAAWGMSRMKTFRVTAPHRVHDTEDSSS